MLPILTQTVYCQPFCPTKQLANYQYDFQVKGEKCNWPEALNIFYYLKIKYYSPSIPMLSILSTGDLVCETFGKNLRARVSSSTNVLATHCCVTNDPKT